MNAINHIGVVGSGTMGNGIAHVCGMSDYKVCLIDPNVQQLSNLEIVQKIRELGPILIGVSFMTPQFFTAKDKSVVNFILPDEKFLLTSSFKPGSKNGILFLFNKEIFFLSLSTHQTLFPKSAKQAPLTRPTYPTPIMQIFIILIFLLMN